MASNTAGWRVAIGLGSNMPGDQGSPEAMIRAAACAVLDLPGTQLLAASQVYATPPWGVVTQDEFRNAVILVTTHLEPLELLHACQNIENEGGRVRLQHWGPRTVDLDLLAAYDAATGEPVISAGRWGEELILPHPYTTARGFVLVPWAEIAPEDTLPRVPGSPAGPAATATVGEWLAQLSQEDTAGITQLGPLLADPAAPGEAGVDVLKNENNEPRKRDEPWVD